MDADVSNHENKRQRLLSAAAGLAAVVLIPAIHLGVIQRLWTPYKQPVDREECSCSCWDTLFKGSYSQYVSGFLHIYINITVNTLVIWCLTVFTVIAGYESLRYVTQLWFKGQLRTVMVFLFLLDLYPNYYSWWGYLNAVNDDFYEQFAHQIFFTSTELLSTYIVLCCCDRSREISPRHLLVILCIALLHIVSSAADQFVSNVLLKKGQGFQVARDVGFMAADIAHVFVSFYLLYKSSKLTSVKQMLSKNDLLIGLAVVFVWFLLMFL